MAMTSRSAVFAHGRAVTTTMRTRTRTMRRSAMTVAAIPVHIEVRFVEGDARIRVDDGDDGSITTRLAIDRFGFGFCFWFWFSFSISFAVTDALVVVVFRAR